VAEVVIMADKVPESRALRRWTRLLVGPSALRRPCDRLEGIVIALLWATFLAVVAITPGLTERLYHSQQAAAARLHPATAVLTENGPSYWLCRLVIDRRRLTAWTADWSLTGPRWPSRL
jgi:hypothetical protein